MSKVLVIYALGLAGSFRRAGTTFTAAGTAFPQGHFDDVQLKAIYAEKRLSVREIDAEQVPGTVDTRLLEATAATQTAKKGPAQQGEGASPTAQTLQQAFAMLDPASKEHFTGGGVPQLDAISRLLGRPVNAAERDAAWKDYAAAQGA